MSWKNEIRKVKASKAEILRIFRSYNGALDAVMDDPEGIQWLYEASLQKVNGNYRWKRFCGNIQELYHRQNYGREKEHQQRAQEWFDNLGQQEEHYNAEQELEGLRRQMVHFQNENRKLIKENRALARKNQVLLKENSLLKSKKSTGGTGLNKKLLYKMFLLFHPDKHDNSKDSNDVTKWLNQQKERIEGKSK